MNPGFDALAGALNDLAEQSEGALADGIPPKHVVQQSADKTRQIAYAATMAARGRIAPGDLGPMLGRDGDEGTLMLGRPGVKPAGRHRGAGALRYVRGWAARIRDGIGG